MGNAFSQVEPVDLGWAVLLGLTGDVYIPTR
jgi:hypothetical protein